MRAKTKPSSNIISHEFIFHKQQSGSVVGVEVVLTNFSPVDRLSFSLLLGLSFGLKR